MLPTTIFLQNTTTSPCFVDIAEHSGQLEIVTRGAVSSSHCSSPDDNTGGNSATGRASTATFRVSAVRCISRLSYALHPLTRLGSDVQKGMTAVAIRFKAATPATDTSGPKNDSVVAPKPTTKTPRAGKGAAAKVAALTPTVSCKSRQVVTFKCRRVTRSSEDPTVEVDDGDAFVTELPFVVLPAAQ